DHELLDLFRHRWPSQLGAALTAVKLLGNQSLVPAQKRGRCGDCRDVLQALTPERVSERREASALNIGKPQPAAAKLGCEDTVFLNQICDHLLLVTLYP